MNPIGPTVRFAAALVVLVAGGTQLEVGTLAAQGVTSAAVQGRVTSESRGNVENAIVALTNTSTGARQQTTTNGAGRYNLENVAPGGPYTLEVRAIGFQAASKSGIMLTLGQRYNQDIELKEQVVTLEELTVVAATNPLINSKRTGAAQTVTDTVIERYPLLGRNFTDLIKTSPQVLSGTGIAGQNNRFNAILIDGGVNNDIFGLSSSGTPGGSAGAKPISVEAMQEFQILAAPFDVRQGSFSGGLVNAVTKSGTNQFHGSGFAYAQRPELVGKDTAQLRVGDFDIKQYGGTISGPIIRNKLLFFGSADVQSSQTPFFGPEATEPSTGISVATAERVQEIIKTKYGFDPGGVTAPQSLNKPDKDFFGKLNYQLGDRTQIELSYNYSHASQDVFNRTSRSDPTRDGWQLNNSGYQIAGITKSLRSKLTTLIGKSNLEVLLGYQRVRDARQLANAVPLILVQGDLTNNYLAAGGEKFSHGNELDQDVYEATANWTFTIGGSHQITVGTHNEFFHFRNLFAQNRYGTWTFGSVDSLDNEQVRRFEVLLEARPGGFTAKFGVRQLGAYVQDSWQVNDRLTLTGGLRYDVPIFGDKPVEDVTYRALIDTLGVHTGTFPSGNGLWSPRLGFNFDVTGRGNTILRGGAGVFSGRPPYVWMSNAFTNTGGEQVTLTCTGAGAVPAFTVDINNIPDRCANAATTPNPAAPVVNYFDKNFKFQQSLRFALGVDQRLPWGLVATGDFLMTRNHNQMYQVDDNLTAGHVNSEGRMLYATPTASLPPSASGSRNIKANSVRQVVHHINKSADRATLFTAQLQKSFAGGVAFSAFYTHGNSKDLMTLGSSIATSNLRNTPLDGTLEDRNLRPAAFDITHKLGLNGTANLPFGIQLAAVYTATSGTPYAYVYTNDANGDGNITNDLFYVPLNRADINIAGSTAAADSAYDRLDAFIQSEECLASQRGHLMRRGSCRNPWSKFLDLRLSKLVPTLSGQSLLITADVFNFLNLLDKNWGLQRSTATFEQVSLLTMSTTAYDLANDRGVYSVPTAMPALRRINVGTSRWRIQLGGKYIF
jgi:outer membrane receptor for ferrienterochelin and colicin